MIPSSYKPIFDSPQFANSTDTLELAKNSSTGSQPTSSSHAGTEQLENRPGGSYQAALIQRLDMDEDSRISPKERGRKYASAQKKGSDDEKEYSRLKDGSVFEREMLREQFEKFLFTPLHAPNSRTTIESTAAKFIKDPKLQAKLVRYINKKYPDMAEPRFAWEPGKGGVFSGRYTTLQADFVRTLKDELYEIPTKLKEGNMSLSEISKTHPGIELPNPSYPRNNIGGGDVGEVKIARRISDSALAAVKISGKHAMSVNDLKFMMTQKDDEHISQIRDGAVLKDHVFQFMELYKFGTVASILKCIEEKEKDEKRKEKVIGSLGYYIVETVAFLHEEGVKHRDLRTANLAVSGKGVVNPIDFGTGTKKDSYGTGPGEPQPGLGYHREPSYTPGATPVSADMNALGEIFKEMAELFPPNKHWEVDKLMEIDRAKSEGRKPDYPQETLTDVGRILSHAPKDRPAAKEILSYRVFEKMGGVMPKEELSAYLEQLFKEKSEA